MTRIQWNGVGGTPWEACHELTRCLGVRKKRRVADDPNALTPTNNYLLIFCQRGVWGVTNTIPTWRTDVRR